MSKLVGVPFNVCGISAYNLISRSCNCWVIMFRSTTPAPDSWCAETRGYARGYADERSLKCDKLHSSSSRTPNKEPKKQKIKN